MSVYVQFVGKENPILIQGLSIDETSVASTDDVILKNNSGKMVGKLSRKHVAGWWTKQEEDAK